MLDQRILAVQRALEGAWGPGSSTKWTPDRPFDGHCGVSTLVAHDLLGGAILKSPFGRIWHFYNRIDGQRVDFTAAQFATPFDYTDVPSSRDEAFGDTNAAQYACLTAAVARRLDDKA